MSTMRKLQRQKMKAKAERLQKAGKGKKDRLFYVLWNGSREAAKDTEEQRKRDEALAKLFNRAKAERNIK